MAEMMKDSGIEWIGMIPTSWKTKKIKYLSVLKGRIGWQGLTSDEYQDDGAFLITGTDFDNGEINWDTCVHIPMKRWDEAKEIQIQNGDLLITKDGTVGKVAIVSDMPGETSLNSGVLRIMTKEHYDRRFLFWVLQSDVFWNWFHYKNAGNSTIVHLYQGDFAEFMYAFPDIKEQQAIADFLDKRCRQIDDVIADIEKQITIIQSTLDSKIYEAVTKGIDQAELKPTKINWAPYIPIHWIDTKVKYICSMRSGENLVSEDIELSGDYPVYGGNGIRGYYDKYTNDGQYVLIGRQGALAGNIHLVDGKFWATDHAVVVYPNNSVDNQYLSFVLYTMDLNQYAFETSAQPGLAVSKILNLDIVLPNTKEEQIRISGFLERQSKQLNSIIADKEKQLQELKNYKKSLIYEYVTGKKRIKEVPPHAD